MKIVPNKNIDSKAYKKITEYCDSILKYGPFQIGRMAISWLHVLNEHPTNLKNYTSINPKVTTTIIKFIANAICVRSIGSLIAVLKKNWYSSKKLDEDINTLIVSHLLNEEHATHFDDFYFGDIERYIGRELNKKTATLQHLHFNISPFEAAKLSREAGASRIYFAKYARPFIEVRIIFIQIFTFMQLIVNGILLNKKGVPYIFSIMAAVSALKSSSAYNLRLYYLLIRFLKFHKPNKILLTYEGHAWERMIIAAAKKVDKKIKCIGYQHAVLFERQHSIYSKQGEAYMPDCIFFSGNTPKNIFIQNVRDANESFVVGTPRNSRACEYIDLKRLKKNYCLFLPDGTYDECVLLIQFALHYAEINKKIPIIVRLHPVVDLGILYRMIPQILSAPPNFEISTQSFDFDLERSRWAIYRGSGAGIRAAAEGVRPIYLKLNGESLGMDCMFELKQWKVSVSNPIDLNNVILRDLKVSLKDLNDEFIPVSIYLSEYFMPYNPKIAFENL